MYLSISMFWSCPVILYYGCSLTVLEVPIIRPRPELLTPRASLCLWWAADVTCFPLSLVGPSPMISLLTSLVGFTTSHSDDYDALLPSFSFKLTCGDQPWLGVTRGGFEIPGIHPRSQGWKPWPHYSYQAHFPRILSADSGCFPSTIKVGILFYPPCSWKGMKNIWIFFAQPHST